MKILERIGRTSRSAVWLILGGFAVASSLAYPSPLLAAQKPAAVPELSILLALDSTPHRLTNPSSVVQSPSGALFATAESGGKSGLGGIFRVSRDGTMTVLHEFTGEDGATPSYPLTLAEDGNFYGTTTNGGAAEHGTLFRISQAGDFKLLHSFTNAQTVKPDPYVLFDASEPTSKLIYSKDGFLYGISNDAGKDGAGAIFRSTLDGQVAIVFDFNNTDYNYPTTLLEGNDGMFYGTTGGDIGTIYRLSRDGQFQPLYLSKFDNEGILALFLQASDGAFYGRAGNTLFQFTADRKFSVLHSLDGVAIYSMVQAPDGNLYGITGEIYPRTTGEFFEYRFSDKTYITSYRFLQASGSGLRNLFFSTPDKTFYGAALDGGPGGRGEIFKFDVLNAELAPSEVASVGIVAKPASVSGKKRVFLFTRTGGEIAKTLSVSIKFKGSAKNGSDFVQAPTVISFPPSKLTVKLRLKAISSASEGKTVKVILLPGQGYEAATNFKATSGF